MLLKRCAAFLRMANDAVAWHSRRCYALQNNLIFVAIGNLSAAAAQEALPAQDALTAFFTVIILSKRLSWP